MDDINWSYSSIYGAGTRSNMDVNDVSSSILGGFFEFGDRFSENLLETTLIQLVAAAKSILESGGHIRSGQLINSITYFIIPEMKTGAYGSDVPYAKWVEWGTSTMEGVFYLSGALNMVKAGWAQ